MSRSLPARHNASLSIEEFNQQPSHHQQNWLLTYVDVFVLIVMLLLTLITFSNFETKHKATKQQIQQQNTKKLIHYPSSSHTKIEPDLLDFNHKQNLAIQERITPALTQVHPADVKKIKITKKSKSSHQTGNILQKQLTNTINDLELLDSINIKVAQGYAQLEIHDKILFDSSESTLLESGETLLKKIIPLLKQSTGLIYIEGHTDNRPINTIKYPSNWELGAARSTSVLHFLASQELEDSQLIAITYGDTKPIADNLTEAGREKNRRVSIMIKVSDKID